MQSPEWLKVSVYVMGRGGMCGGDEERWHRATAEKLTIASAQLPHGQMHPTPFIH